MWSFRVALVGLIAVLQTSASSQVLYELISPNEQEHSWFGFGVACGGDVNQDGYTDMIVGAMFEAANGVPSSGRVHVFDGATGTAIRTLTSPNQGSGGNFGRSVSSIVDINGDDCSDIIVGAYKEGPDTSWIRSGRAYVLSGASGGVLLTLVSPFEEHEGRFGCSVADAGDINADGVHDIIVGAEFENPEGSPMDAGRAYVFNGSTGSLLFVLSSPNEEEGGGFGCSVTGLGDTNGDGHSDVVVGAFQEDPGSSPTGAGRAYVFSGDTGDVLLSLESPNQSDVGGWFGRSVSGAGDVDGNGVPDVVIGAHGESVGQSPTFSGSAYVFEGSTGLMLLALVSPNQQTSGHFGRSVSGAGDIDVDGHSDVIIGAYYESPELGPDHAGCAYVFSGINGALLSSLSSPNAEYLGGFGCSVAGCGDVNGDGFDDVLVGAWQEDPGDSPQSAGRAYACSGYLIPVELSVFEAAVACDGIQIRWRTETEYECFGFHLYRQVESDDRRQQITDQIIPGAGTSSTPHHYTFLDPVTDSGAYRYWLVEIAEDGNRTEYGPVEATIHPSRLTLNGPYPNPVIEEAELRLFVPERISGSVELKLFDLQGRQTGKSITLWGEQGDVIRWNAATTGTAPGLYWWRLRAGNEIASAPMVVVK